MPSSAAVQPAELFVPRGADDLVDTRTGGRWTRRQALKNRLVRWAVRAALALADELPERVLVSLGALFGRIAARLLTRSRGNAEARAARCFPTDEARRLAMRAFENAGENLCRCLLLRRDSVRALDSVFIAESSRRLLAETLAGGRGAVFISAHLGPFEGIAAAVAELGYKPAVVVRESYDRALNGFVDHHRIRRGVSVIHRGSPRAAFSIARALRAGQPVGFLPDLGARVASIEIDFLGDRVAFPIGPQLIAARAEAPILVGVLAREPGSSGFELLLERIPGSADPIELTHRVAGALERRILAGADQWLWMAPPIRRLPPEKGGR